ncbi:unnamed protein product [Gulo gulo]|uniref:Uncharacterized protein n=1 Tax=Gulo gulo TaxID=48420 RepID=A0A9X9M0D7_GULGU|nr:unnamed protein product [Gulo gulo]
MVEGRQRPRKKERHRPVISPTIGPWPYLSPPGTHRGSPRTPPWGWGAETQSHFYQ